MYLHDQALLSRFVVKPVGNVPEGLQSVSFGQIDAYVENLAVAAYYIDKKGIPNLRVAGTTDFSFAWSIGVSRKYPLLYSSIQKALDGIPENQFAKIRKKWISLETDFGIDPETLWLLKLATLFAVLLVVSLTAITFILKYRLNQKVTDLRKSESRYRRLAENSPAVVYQFVMAPDGTFLFPYINEVSFAVTGVSSEEAIRDSSALINKIHPADMKLFQEGIQESAISLKPYHATFRYDKNGQYIWLEAHSTPERMPDGSIFWDGFFLDTTERKKSEEALQESEEKYRELVENANSIILRMDKEGQVTFFNEFAQRFFGFPKEEIIGRNVIGTIVPEKDTSGRDLAAMIADIGHNPEAYATNENENICRNGERVWIAWTNRPKKKSPEKERN